VTKDTEHGARQQATRSRAQSGSEVLAVLEGARVRAPAITPSRRDPLQITMGDQNVLKEDGIRLSVVLILRSQLHLFAHRYLDIDHCYSHAYCKGRAVEGSMPDESG
jgi:hypothetical protein